jgi:cell division GTPase FtsZ
MQAMAHMGVGRATGKNKAEEAAKAAVFKPAYETSIDGARRRACKHSRLLWIWALRS